MNNISAGFYHLSQIANIELTRDEEGPMAMVTLKEDCTAPSERPSGLTNDWLYVHPSGRHWMGDDYGRSDYLDLIDYFEKNFKDQPEASVLQGTPTEESSARLVAFGESHAEGCEGDICVCGFSYRYKSSDELEGLIKTLSVMRDQAKQRESRTIPADHVTAYVKQTKILGDALPQGQQSTLFRRILLLERTHGLVSYGEPDIELIKALPSDIRETYSALLHEAVELVEPITKKDLADMVNDCMKDLLKQLKLKIKGVSDV